LKQTLAHARRGHGHTYVPSAESLIADGRSSVHRPWKFSLEVFRVEEGSEVANIARGGGGGFRIRKPRLERFRLGHAVATRQDQLQQDVCRAGGPGGPFSQVVEGRGGRAGTDQRRRRREAGGGEGNEERGTRSGDDRSLGILPPGSSSRVTEPIGSVVA